MWPLWLSVMTLFVSACLMPVFARISPTCSDCINVYSGSLCCIPASAQRWAHIVDPKTVSNVDTSTVDVCSSTRSGVFPWSNHYRLCLAPISSSDVRYQCTKINDKINNKTSVQDSHILGTLINNVSTEDDGAALLTLLPSMKLLVHWKLRLVLSTCTLCLFSYQGTRLLYWYSRQWTCTRTIGRSRHARLASHRKSL